MREVHSIYLYCVLPYLTLTNADTSPQQKLGGFILEQVRSWQILPPSPVNPLMHTGSSLANLVRSLLVALCIGFLLPIVGILTALAGLIVVGYIPGLLGLSQIGLQTLANFLMTFGDGSCVEGTLVIGGAFALVTLLFDGYVTYRHRSL